MSDPDLTLYGLRLSGHSHRAELFLSLLGLPYRFVEVASPAQRGAAAFRRLNPLGQIPVLTDGPAVIPDSNAILVYLAARYAPDGGWMPGDPLAAAQVQRWLSIAAGEVRAGPAQARLMVVFGAPGDRVTVHAAAARILAVMEGHLTDRTHLAGRPADARRHRLLFLRRPRARGRRLARALPGRAGLDRTGGSPAGLRPDAGLPDPRTGLSCAMASFHADERLAQARAGQVLGETPAIRPFMPDQHRTFFSGLPYLFVATVDGTGAPVATVLTGPPGFVQAPDATHLTVAASLDPADPAARCLVPGAEVGILGIDFATRRRNRANGRALRRDPDRLTVAVNQSFGNCPQYIQRRVAEPVRRPVGPVEILTALDADAAALIRETDTLFVASRARDGLADGGADLSHRGGRPGFVRLRDDVLTVPDFSGNRYFNTLGNLIGEPRAALLILDFARGDLLVLQGRAAVDWSGADADAPTGAQRAWSFTVTGGWRRRAAVPLLWSAPEPAAQIARTGLWREPA